MKLSFAFFILLIASSSVAQQVGRNKPSGESSAYTISVKSQLVVENVVVKDKQGRFIQGLTEKDFSVTEVGVPQEIVVCEHADFAGSPG
jgi:hypothetical protein